MRVPKIQPRYFWFAFMAAALWSAARPLVETRPLDTRPSMERADEDRQRLDRGEGPLQNYGDLPVRSDAGRLTISPVNDVPVAETGTWTLTFEVGPAGLAVNDGLLVYIPHGWSAPLTLEQGFPSQLRYNNQIEKATSTSAGLCTAAASRKETTVRLFSTWKDQTRLGEGVTLWVAVEDAPLKEGDTIEITYGDLGYGGPGALSAYFTSQFEFNTLVFRQMDWEKFNDMIWQTVTGGSVPRYVGLMSAASEFFYVARPPRIRTIGREASRFEVYVPSLVTTGEAFDVHVVAFDAGNNPASGYNGKIEFEPRNHMEQPPSFDFNLQEEPFARFTDGVTIDKPGIYRLKVYDSHQGLSGVSNPVEVVAETATKLYWGDLHIHTWESDGLNTVSDAYRFGRDLAALDFCAISDHSTGVKPPQRAAARKFLDEGRFVAFSGWEQTVRNGGHVNVYFVDDSEKYETLYSPEISKREFWERLRSFGEGNVIAIPHNHAGGGWDDFDDEVVRLNELYSVWGNSEVRDPAERPYRLSGRAGGRRIYQDALQQGLRLGCIGSGDEHAGRPGYGDWLRHFRSWRNGMVAAYAPSLTRKDLFAALWDRTVYATTGARIILDVELNGERMGKQLTAADVPRTLRVKVVGTADIRSVEVVRNNQVYYTHQGHGPEAAFEIRDATPLDGGAYYYVRVTQQDTHLAWSSPIWVEPRS